MVDITHYYDVSYVGGDSHLMTVSGCGKSNRFYVFGGKDEGSYKLVQGLTLAGVLFDEVALMPESFVNQRSPVPCLWTAPGCGLTATRTARTTGLQELDTKRQTTAKEMTCCTCISQCGITRS